MTDKLETIKLSQLEKTILQIALKRQMEELEKVSRKAITLGVDTTNAVQKDLNILKDLETKLL